MLTNQMFHKWQNHYYTRNITYFIKFSIVIIKSAGPSRKLNISEEA